jgi:hypothetical protein
MIITIKVDTAFSNYREDFNEVHGSALHRYRLIAGRLAHANFVDDISNEGKFLPLFTDRREVLKMLFLYT